MQIQKRHKTYTKTSEELTFSVCLLVAIILSCQPAWAGKKKHTFDAPSESVFQAALRVANEQHKVQYKEEQHKTFVFTTGISSLSWGMRVLATVVDVEPGKSSMTLELHKKVGSLQLTQWGAGGRMADNFFEQVEQELRRPPDQPSSAPLEAVRPEEAATDQRTIRSIEKEHPDQGKGTLIVVSVPTSAELHVDGSFIGNTPSTLRLSAGPHMIRLVVPSYRVWTREVTVLSDSEATLNAALEKGQ